MDLSFKFMLALLILAGLLMLFAGWRGIKDNEEGDSDIDNFYTG